MPFFMPMVATPLNRTDFTENGKHECVAFVKQITKAPATPHWGKGLKVLDAEPGSIRFGTAIATFDKLGNYSHGGSGRQHAAIYISHVKNESIKVYDQNNATKKVKTTQIHDLSTDMISNNPDWFYVIEYK